MRSVIFCLLFSFFVDVKISKVLSDPVKSYENHQVLRVKITSKDNFDLLASIDGLNFWNSGRVGGFADVMVAPNDIDRVKAIFLHNRFEFTTMIENVGDLIRLEKVERANESNKLKMISDFKK